MFVVKLLAVSGGNTTTAAILLGRTSLFETAMGVTLGLVPALVILFAVIGLFSYIVYAPQKEYRLHFTWLALALSAIVSIGLVVPWRLLLLVLALMFLTWIVCFSFLSIGFRLWKYVPDTESR